MKYAPIIALAVLFVVAACTTVPQPPTTTPPTTVPAPNADLSLTQFGSEEEFLASFQQGGGGFNAFGAVERQFMAVAESADSSAGAPTASIKSDGFSETNVQVEGVDEADIIKTDGEYIYTISGQTLFIVDAVPGEDARVLEEIDFEDQNPSALFIDGNRLMVIGSEWGYQGKSRIAIWPGNSNTFIAIYDISDKRDPELVEEYRMEGSYFQGRLKDGVAYVATRTWPNYYGVPELPIIMRGDVEERLSIADIWRYPFPYNNPSLTTLHAIDMNDGDRLESKAVVTEGQTTLYMSHDNIYLATTQHVDTNRLREEVTIELLMRSISEKDKRLIERIQDTDGDILSEREKRQKILQVVTKYVQKFSEKEQRAFEDDVEDAYKAKLREYDYLEHTLLTRIEYRDGDLDIEADGQVAGSVNNQFSMDEHDGVLRIATTVNAQWDWVSEERSVSENHIYTLDKDLDVLDSVTGLAKDETIFSTRFTADRLYMVTFRQVDPFFTVDLSNPRNIQVEGELKITGFSRYLHIYGEDTVIGLGQEATDQGRPTGLKISLFDVSDINNPTEIASYKAGSKYSSSSAEFEHHAFLFSKEKNLLVIPAYQWGGRGDFFNGVLVFDIERDDIDLVGEIAHDEGDNYRYQAAVERSLYIDDLLYTKSLGQIRIHELGSLDHVEDVELDYDDGRRYAEPYFAGGGLVEPPEEFTDIAIDFEAEG